MFAASGFDATTIVDIAAAAGISVQTVFNHFASKEELFFADRAAWVEGPAAAVRDCRAGVRPTAALRRHLVASVEGYARATSDPRHQRMIEVLLGTPALQTYERDLHEEAVALLTAELTAASRNWRNPDGTGTALLAELTASLWMAAVRTVVVNLRSDPSPMTEDAVRASVALIDRVLGDLEVGLSFAPLSAPSARAS